MNNNSTYYFDNPMLWLRVCIKYVMYARQEYKGMVYLFLFLAALFWGGSFIATRYALTLGGFTVFSLLMFRFLISSLILVTISLVRKIEALKAGDIGKLFLVGLVYPGLYFLFETTGIERTPAFISSIIIASIPVLTGIMARIFLKEHLNFRGWAGVFISIAGITLVVLGENGGRKVSGGDISLIGVLLVFGAALTGAFYTTTTRYLLSRYKPLTLTTFQNVLAFIFFSPLGIIQLTGRQFSVNGWGVVSVLFLGVFASVVAFLSFNKALSLMEAGRASLFLNTIPIISLVLAWLFLGERITVVQLAGILVVVSGVTLASIGKGDYS